MWISFPIFYALLLLRNLVSTLPVVSSSQAVINPVRNRTRVLILGGGVAGITAARALQEEGISDFIVVEARGELGGRLMSHTFGASRKQYTVEVGANWIQGTRTGNGAENPILSLAREHDIAVGESNYFGSITTYDSTGAFDFTDIFNSSIKNYNKLVASAGERVPNRLVDMTARGGYSMTGSKPLTRHEMAAEYYQFDWEFAGSPEDTSWLASSWAHNYTFRADAGGFSLDNLLSIDQRGFKSLVQSEAHAFLASAQIRLNSTVSTISTLADGVQIALADGETLTADYALCTFSLGVLQHDDVLFDPALPAWKLEAIHSMMMGTYTKIFLQFPEKFWFDTEMALYADNERGRYPVWQSLDHNNFIPGSGILFVTVTGDFSRRIETMLDSQVKTEVLSVLRTMFPAKDVPEPLDFYFQRWHSDPLFRGAYSNWPASFLSEHQANLRADIDERLWFAGEVTSRKHFGFLHGAYYEGADIGRRIAGCVKGGGCVGLGHIERVRNANSYDVGI